MTKNQILVTPQGNGKVTKAFAKQASIFGTTEFKQWREFLSEFPNAKMIIKTPKKNSNRKTYSNMTYENMRNYISVQENAEELAKEFEKNLVLSKMQTNPYLFMIAWFEQKFENYDDYKKHFQKQKEENKKLKLAVKRPA